MTNRGNGPNNAPSGGEVVAQALAANGIEILFGSVAELTVKSDVASVLRMTDGKPQLDAGATLRLENRRDIAVPPLVASSSCGNSAHSRKIYS